ncbi:MAG: hypothetical protein KGN80_06350, partial [Acidobacteriota bacterium]|nr:hypothetical protein [Acidobacteriota bacterium]
MSVFRRFFKEHLARRLPTILGGSLLLLVAGLCQGLLLFTLNFVFKDSLKMGGGSTTGVFAWADHAKAWLLSQLPTASNLRESTLFIPVLLVAIYFMKGLLTYLGTLTMVRSGLRATLEFRERLFGHLLTQEPAFFQDHPVGELLTRSI